MQLCTSLYKLQSTINLITNSRKSGSTSSLHVHKQANAYRNINTFRNLVQIDQNDFFIYLHGPHQDYWASTFPFLQNAHMTPIFNTILVRLVTFCSYP